MDVNPERAIASLKARRDEIANPAHVRLVDVWIEHLESERAADVQRILAHLADDVRYRRWGFDRDEFSGKDYVQKRFESVREAGGGSWPEYEFEIDRFLVGDDCIVMDGLFKSHIQGSQLIAQNTLLPEGATEGDSFVLERRYCMFVTFRDGFIIGEDAYRDKATISKVT